MAKTISLENIHFLAYTNTVDEMIMQYLKQPISNEDKPKKKRKKKTYKRNWSLYNLAKTEGMPIYLRLTSLLVDLLPIKKIAIRMGAPPKEMRIMLKCCAVKVFINRSSRDSVGFLKLVYPHLDMLYSEIPHFNTISNYMRNHVLKYYLGLLISLSFEPFKEIEKSFSVDSSGVGTANYQRWFDKKYGENKYRKKWLKLHIICGNFLNAICSAIITEGNKADSPVLKQLLDGTVYTSIMKILCADPAYLSRPNCNLAEDLGTILRVKPKKNTTRKPKGSKAWKENVSLAQDHPEIFAKEYHKRSNVETDFWMIKGKNAGFVWSIEEEGQENEILFKVFNHNVRCLARGNIEFDIKLPN